MSPETIFDGLDTRGKGPILSFEGLVEYCDTNA